MSTWIVNVSGCMGKIKKQNKTAVNIKEIRSKTDLRVPAK